MSYAFIKLQYICNLPFISHFPNATYLLTKDYGKKMAVRKLYLTRIKPRIKMALMDIPPDKYARILSLCTVTM